MNEKELELLREKAKNCKMCTLWQYREKSVFGEGPADADIMLIGLGPGPQENKQGRPFVGPAGKLLNVLLELAGFKREEVYITNVVKCYPPNNSPSPEHVSTCTKNYLEKQIEIIKPKTIITLGNLSTEWAFKKYKIKLQPMNKIHGKIFYLNIDFPKKIIPMYHPAAALRNPPLREVLMKDWKKIGEELGIKKKTLDSFFK